MGRRVRGPRRCKSLATRPLPVPVSPRDEDGWQTVRGARSHESADVGAQGVLAWLAPISSSNSFMGASTLARPQVLGNRQSTPLSRGRRERVLIESRSRAKGRLTRSRAPISSRLLEWLDERTDVSLGELRFGSLDGDLWVERVQRCALIEPVVGHVFLHMLPVARGREPRRRSQDLECGDSPQQQADQRQNRRQPWDIPSAPQASFSAGPRETRNDPGTEDQIARDRHPPLSVHAMHEPQSVYQRCFKLFLKQNELNFTELELAP